MSLEPLFNKVGCDKSKKHQYHRFYDALFESYPKTLKILEIGVFKGDSTVAFLEYMPKAKLYGVDIFERVSIDDVTQRVNSKRASFAQCDSMNQKSVIKAMKEFDTQFDVIIDDGAHWPEANRLTLANFMPYLNSKGTYVIEDVWPFHKMSTEEMNHPWLKKYPQRYDLFEFTKFQNQVDTFKDMYNLDIQEYDYRKYTNEPDSCIMSLKRNL